MASPGSKAPRRDAGSPVEAAGKAADDSGRRQESRELSGPEPVPEGNHPIPDSPGGSSFFEEAFETDWRNELQNTLEEFKDDMRKMLEEKRERVMMETSASIENVNQKIDEVWIAQNEQRKKLYHEYSQQFLTLFQEWNVNMKKIKKEEEILASILQLQQELLPHYQIVHRKKMQALNELREQFLKSMEDLEKSQERLLVGERSALRKEMVRLQKPFLMKHVSSVIFQSEN
uniref:XLR/SYCP3/FAM9 domain-containing protein n=1 Tax=Suricata suricatta TaxID=37032 RepID=A0A673VGM6_SURSU